MTPRIGRRIVVWGVTGSGKTTLARQLGEALGLGVVELDAIRHANGWDSTDFDDFAAILQRRLADLTAGWVVDGSYSRISYVYIRHADTIVWLHLPWRVSFWRLLKRTLARAWTHEPLYHPEGPRESWRLSFLSRRSILWWSISHHRASVRNVRRRLSELRPDVAVHELRTPGEVRLFLQNITSSADLVAPRKEEAPDKKLPSPRKEGGRG